MHSLRRSLSTGCTYLLETYERAEESVQLQSDLFAIEQQAFTAALGQLNFIFHRENSFILICLIKYSLTLELQ